MWTVYKHTAPNGKVYIGITGQKPEYRWNNGNGYIENKHFYSAIRSYKWENFKHDILETGLTKEQACAKEIELIAKYDSANREKGYNNSTGGECSALGIHLSAETRRKISESNKGKHKEHHSSPETRRKISEAQKGRHLSAETRRKLSEANKGKIPCNKGKHHSPEARKKISESLKGTHRSPETRKKMSESSKGKNAKAVICIETGILYSSATEAAESIGVTKGVISKAVRGVQKTAGGYHWKYAEA